MEFLCYGTQQVGFQARVILDLWGMVFHAMVAFCLEVDVLLNSISTCCDGRVNSVKLEVVCKAIIRIVMSLMVFFAGIDRNQASCT